MPKYINKSQVDFYILTHEKLTARNHFACRIIDKAYRRGHRVYIHTASQQEAHRIDEMLWTFRDISFVPHNLCGEGPTYPPPVQIGFEQNPAAFNDILINLTTQIPNWYTRFKRIIEIIPNETSWRKNAREHYRFYRSQGSQLNSHDISTTA